MCVIPDGAHIDEVRGNADADEWRHCQQGSVPCAPGKNYFGRGPLQLTWNYNYQEAGQAIRFDGINDPGIVARDPVISFKTAIWFWMTQTTTGESLTCHQAMEDEERFGVTIDNINGGYECHKQYSQSQQDRIELYKSYCHKLGIHVNHEDHLGC